MAQHYIGDIVDDASESRRLSVLEALYDPPTVAALDKAGLRPGLSVLEIGPGRGSLLPVLSAAVGAAGRVVGIDQNPRFLQHVDLPNVGVIAGDFNEAAFADAPFDLIYLRFVLMHLPDVAASLRRMRELLRPGGALVALDIDFASHVACDPGHPSAAAFDRHRAAIDAALAEADLTDLHFGRRMPGLLAGAGFTVASLEYGAKVVQGGSEEAWFWKRNAEVTAKAAVDAGTLAPDALAILPIHDDPSFGFLQPLLAVAIAHRPPET